MNKTFNLPDITVEFPCQESAIHGSVMESNQTRFVHDPYSFTGKRSYEAAPTGAIVTPTVSSTHHLGSKRMASFSSHQHHHTLVVPESPQSCRSYEYSLQHTPSPVDNYSPKSLLSERCGQRCTIAGDPTILLTQPSHQPPHSHSSYPVVHSQVHGNGQSFLLPERSPNPTPSPKSGLHPSTPLPLASAMRSQSIYSQGSSPRGSLAVSFSNDLPASSSTRPIPNRLLGCMGPSPRGSFALPSSYSSLDSPKLRSCGSPALSPPQNMHLSVPSAGSPRTSFAFSPSTTSDIITNGNVINTSACANRSTSIPSVYTSSESIPQSLSCVVNGCASCGPSYGPSCSSSLATTILPQQQTLSDMQPPSFQLQHRQRQAPMDLALQRCSSPFLDQPNPLPSDLLGQSASMPCPSNVNGNGAVTDSWMPPIPSPPYQASPNQKDGFHPWNLLAYSFPGPVSQSQQQGLDSGAGCPQTIPQHPLLSEDLAFPASDLRNNSVSADSTMPSYCGLPISVVAPNSNFHLSRSQSPSLRSPGSPDSPDGASSQKRFSAPHEHMIPEENIAAFAVGAPCDHTEHWRRLRWKKGVSQLLCRQCGGKWKSTARITGPIPGLSS